jgi:hypothetical protein
MNDDELIFVLFKRSCIVRTCSVVNSKHVQPSNFFQLLVIAFQGNYDHVGWSYHCTRLGSPSSET